MHHRVWTDTKTLLLNRSALKEWKSGKSCHDPDFCFDSSFCAFSLVPRSHKWHYYHKLTSRCAGLTWELTEESHISRSCVPREMTCSVHCSVSPDIWIPPQDWQKFHCYFVCPALREILIHQSCPFREVFDYYSNLGRQLQRKLHWWTRIHLMFPWVRQTMFS